MKAEDIKVQCPRTGAKCGIRECTECWKAKLYAGVDCPVIKSMRDQGGRTAAGIGPAADPSGRRNAGVVCVVVGVVMLIMGISWGRESANWALVGGIGFITACVGFCIAFPVLAQVLGNIGAGVVLGNSAEKALRNLANMDKFTNNKD